MVSEARRYCGSNYCCTKAWKFAWKFAKAAVNVCVFARWMLCDMASKHLPQTRVCLFCSNTDNCKTELPVNTRCCTIAGRTARCRYKFWVRHNGIVRFLYISERSNTEIVRSMLIFTAVTQNHGDSWRSGQPTKITGKKPWRSWIRDYLTVLRNDTTPTSTNFGFEVRTTWSIFTVWWRNVYLRHNCK